MTHGECSRQDEADDTEEDCALRDEPRAEQGDERRQQQGTAAAQQQRGDRDAAEDLRLIAPCPLFGCSRYIDFCRYAHYPVTGCPRLQGSAGPLHRTPIPFLATLLS